MNKYMSKSLVNNQRLVLKINSKKLRYANWDFKISLEEAKQGEELVSLGDSQALRMIRQIRGCSIKEEDINEIKKNIKALKTATTNANNKQRIKEEYEKLMKATFIEDYVVIVFDSIDDWNKVNSTKVNLMINGKEYVRLLGTSGGIKKSAVVFVTKEIHGELYKRLNCDRDMNYKCVPAKFEAYIALSCSSSMPVPQPKDILVIKDGSTHFIDKVLRLSDNGEGGFNLSEDDNYEINLNCTDGCGMISPRLSMEWTKFLCGRPYRDNEGNPIPSTGYNIRNAWTKGMLFTFPYEEFGDMIGEYLVEDYWGDMVDIRNVDLVLTDNMLKLAGAYKNRHHYLNGCKKSGFEFSVAKIIPEVLESVRNMNYQFLQSYEMTDEEINELIAPTVDSIRSATGYNNVEDFGKMLLFLKGSKISKEDFINEEFPINKALMINPRMINDPYLKNRAYNMLRKKINDSKKGVIQVKGNYQIVSGDLYGMCQNMFKREITGLLKREEFYSREWLDKGAKEIVSFRAPMTVHNNIVKMKLVENEEINKWYRYMNKCIVLNSWDATCEAMNGCDFDGDAFISTDNPVLLRNTRKLRPLICEILERKFIEKEGDAIENRRVILKNVSEIETKIKNVVRRFADGDIDRDVYKARKAELEADLERARTELEKYEEDFSNLAQYTDEVIATCSMLGSYWGEMDFNVCQKIQKLVFPEGAYWDHENRRFRTDGMNSVASYLFSLSDTYKNNNAKKEGKSDDLSSLVAGAGLEPAAFGL